MKNMHFRITTLLLVLLPLLPLHAQRRVLMYDPETNKPLDKVTVWTDYNKPDTTNILGQV